MADTRKGKPAFNTSAAKSDVPKLAPALGKRSPPFTGAQDGPTTKRFDVAPAATQENKGKGLTPDQRKAPGVAATASGVPAQSAAPGNIAEVALASSEAVTKKRAAAGASQGDSEQGGKAPSRRTRHGDSAAATLSQSAPPPPGGGIGYSAANARSGRNPHRPRQPPASTGSITLEEMNSRLAEAETRLLEKAEREKAERDIEHQQEISGLRDDLRKALASSEQANDTLREERASSRNAKDEYVLMKDSVERSNERRLKLEEHVKTAEGREATTRAELVAAQAAQAATQAELVATKAKLAATQAQLTAALAEVQAPKLAKEERPAAASAEQAVGPSNGMPPAVHVRSAAAAAEQAVSKGGIRPMGGVRPLIDMSPAVSMQPAAGASEQEVGEGVIHPMGGVRPPSGMSPAMGGGPAVITEPEAAPDAPLQASTPMQAGLATDLQGRAGCAPLTGQRLAKASLAENMEDPTARTPLAGAGAAATPLRAAGVPSGPRGVEHSMCGSRRMIVAAPEPQQEATPSRHHSARKSLLPHAEQPAAGCRY